MQFAGITVDSYDAKEICSKKITLSTIDEQPVNTLFFHVIQRHLQLIPFNGNGK